MAKQFNGYLGGFSGTMGPAIGYCWNGKWCMRSRPVVVRNPRTEAQQLHREAFKEQVQLAARMRMVVTAALTLPAREAGMTSYNLFVSMNHAAFAGGGVDYSLLRVSTGPLAPVAFGVPEVDADGVLTVGFEPNPMRCRADRYDGVRVYAYCPELRLGFLSAPVYRGTKRLSMLLPSTMRGRELVLYGFVQNEEGRCSESVYIPMAEDDSGVGETPAEAEGAAAAEPMQSGAARDGAAEPDGQADTGPLGAAR